MICNELVEFITYNKGLYEYNPGAVASGFTTFHIGGAVSAAILPKTKGALVALLRFLREYNVRYTVLGCGSNVLFDDNGYDGVVVITTDVNEINITGEDITVDCGKTLTSTARAAQRAGLSGFEFAYGIPGSVGGAVTMNAGAYGGEIKDIIVSAEVWNHIDGTIETLDTDMLGLSYRESVIKRGGRTVLSAKFKCHAAGPEVIDAEMNEYMCRRREKQPLDYPSAGSVFKRYPGYYTAKLIEDAGLKGLRVGGAEVSVKHAGFIINVGGAKAADVKALIDVITEKIRSKYGIEIERELIYMLR